MTTSSRIAIVGALVVAATAVWWLRSDSGSDDRGARGIDGDPSAREVALSRLAQFPAPPPQLPDVPRPGEEERKLPAGWDTNVRSAPAESVTMRRPSPGEVAPVRAYRFWPGVQPPSADPPNPLLPPKQDLSEDELRAGLPPE